MCKLYFSFIGLLFFSLCQSQTTENGTEHSQFVKYVNCVLEDTTNRWSEYPKPPHLTIEVLSGLKKEIEKDSVRYYFDYLKYSDKKTLSDYMTSYNYFEKHHNVNCLFAMMAHWNPDVRVYTMININEKLKGRSILNSGIKINAKLSGDDLLLLSFLIYLLESNPLIISGSENSTIHGNYISLIASNLDLLTGENSTNGKQLRDWYKNDLQFESAVLKWKSHIPSK